MALLSMNETTTFRWSFEEDVANYAAAGIIASFFSLSRLFKEGKHVDRYILAGIRLL